MNKILHLLTIIFILIITSACSTNFAIQKDNNREGLTESTLENEKDYKTSFYQNKGIAIEGTDPVAYFIEAEAIPGNPQYAYEWANVTWWFKNEANRDLFVNNPDKYAPQYGGFCAWAVSQNYTAPIDPQAWKIVAGKLYLNYNQKIQKRWKKDLENNIAKGDQNWPQLLTNLIN